MRGYLVHGDFLAKYYTHGKWRDKRLKKHDELQQTTKNTQLFIRCFSHDYLSHSYT